jgi:hypothetical protein
MTQTLLSRRLACIVPALAVSATLSAVDPPIASVSTSQTGGSWDGWPVQEIMNTCLLTW